MDDRSDDTADDEDMTACQRVWMTAARHVDDAYLRATELHLPYELTECYLPPDTGEHTPP